MAGTTRGGSRLRARKPRLARPCDTERIPPCGAFWLSTGTEPRLIGRPGPRPHTKEARNEGSDQVVRHEQRGRGCGGEPAALIAVVRTGVNALPSAAKGLPPPIGVGLSPDRAVFTDNVDLKIKNKLDGKATQVANVKNPSRVVGASRSPCEPDVEFGWHTVPSAPCSSTSSRVKSTNVPVDDCVERQIPWPTPRLSTLVGTTSTTLSTARTAYGFGSPRSSEGALRRDRSMIPRDAPADCEIRSNHDGRAYLPLGGPLTNRGRPGRNDRGVRLSA